MDHPSVGAVPFREIADQLKVGLMFADPEGRILYYNEAEARARGISRAHLLGHSVLDCHPPAKQARVRELLGSIVAGVSPGQFRMREHDASFTEQWISPLYGENGRILGILLLSIDVTARELSRRELEVQATRDELTGLFNKNHFSMVFPAIRAQLGRELPSVALLMADLNGLKTINDLQGHVAGDRVIAGAGLVLRRSMRVTDHVFRFGGDEFVVLQPGADEAAAQATFRRIKANCRRWSAAHAGLQLNLAVGWQVARTPEEADRALSLADEAMYRDKRREKARSSR